MISVKDRVWGHKQDSEDVHVETKSVYPQVSGEVTFWSEVWAMIWVPIRDQIWWDLARKER